MTHPPGAGTTSPIPESPGERDWALSAALRKSAALFFCWALLFGGGDFVEAARRPAQELALHHVRVRLPGPPAAVVPADLNRDGLQDLAVIVAYTDLENVGQDRIENMVQVSTVIPALFERRELHLFAAAIDGSLAPTGPPLVLPPDVLSIKQAPGGQALIAMTDSGVSRLELDAEGATGFTWTRVIEDPPVLAGSKSFFSKLRWTHDVDGDGWTDVVLPGEDGPAIYLGRGGELSATPSARLQLPGDARGVAGRVWRSYPWPEFRDIDDDGIVDLVSIAGKDNVGVFLGDGRGGFLPHGTAQPDCPGSAARVRVRDDEGRLVEDRGRLVHFADVDGGGRAEWVTVEELEPAKDGLRAGLKQIKRPKQRFRFHRLREDLSVESVPYLELAVEGHSFEDVDFGAGTSGLFQDLDGDGRAELVTVTLRFSILQALKVLVTKRIGVGLDFHVRNQSPDGSFHEVEGLDLSERLRFDLGDLRLNRLAQFAGDFDGDGRTDFVHLGRGKRVTIHRGAAGCRYPVKPDRVIELETEPQDLGLVRIADFDADGRADLAVTRLLPPERAGVSAPVTLDLYLSGDAP